MAATFYSDPAYFEVIDKDVSGVEVKAIRGLSLSGFVVTEGDVQKGRAGSTRRAQSISEYHADIENSTQ